MRPHRARHVRAARHGRRAAFHAAAAGAAELHALLLTLDVGRTSKPPTHHTCSLHGTQARRVNVARTYLPPPTATPATRAFLPPTPSSLPAPDAYTCTFIVTRYLYLVAPVAIGVYYIYRFDGTCDTLFHSLGRFIDSCPTVSPPHLYRSLLQYAETTAYSPGSRAHACRYHATYRHLPLSAFMHDAGACPPLLPALPPTTRLLPRTL